MLNKLWCWLFGCKFKQKAITMILDKQEANPITGAMDHIKLYRWQQLPFCLRCNLPNPHYKEY